MTQCISGSDPYDTTSHLTPKVTVIDLKRHRSTTKEKYLAIPTDITNDETNLDLSVCNILSQYAGCDSSCIRSNSDEGLGLYSLLSQSVVNKYNLYEFGSIVHGLTASKKKEEEANKKIFPLFITKCPENVLTNGRVDSVTKEQWNTQRGQANNKVSLGDHLFTNIAEGDSLSNIYKNDLKHVRFEAHKHWEKLKDPEAGLTKESKMQFLIDKWHEDGIWPYAYTDQNSGTQRSSQ